MINTHARILVSSRVLRARHRPPTQVGSGPHTPRPLAGGSCARGSYCQTVIPPASRSDQHTYRETPISVIYKLSLAHYAKAEIFGVTFIVTTRLLNSLHIFTLYKYEALSDLMDI